MGILRRGTSNPQTAIAFLCIGLFAAACAAGCFAGRPAEEGPHGTGSAPRAREEPAYGVEELAEEMAKIDGAEISRFGETVKATWASARLFDSDSAMLRLDARETVRALAGLLARYPLAEIVVAVHTDGRGPADHDLELSRRRATSIAADFVALGVPPSKLGVEGHGGLLPVATSDTEEGRRLNSRVEIIVRAREH